MDSTLTKTQQALQLLEQGGKTPEEICQALGLSHKGGQRLISNLKTFGYITVPPKKFVLTPRGAEHVTLLKGRTGLSPGWQKQKARLAALAQADAQKPRDGHSVVRAARSLPNSVFSLVP